MDTAQRGTGLDWPAARLLIERSLAAAAPAERKRIVCGVGTDHLDPAEARSLDDIVTAYHEQLAAVQKAGGRVVLMASRALARIATSPADYETVYARVLAEADEPVILHWLGEMFDPALAGYWGAGSSSRPRSRPRCPSSMPTPPGSTGSSCPSWTTERKSPCAGACRTASGCTRATTSTIRR